MGKKRAREADGAAAAPDKMATDADSSDDEDFDILNVDFEWFNYKPDIDFHGVKALLRQLFGVDNALFDVSGLADLILSQPTIGSTVKVNGEETDPIAMMTVLNMQEHKDKKPLADLVQYLTAMAKTNEALASIPELLAAGKHVGLVLTERLLNVPAEISPPMFNMLIDEVEAAVEDKEPYEFSHYLVLSKTYNEVESKLNDEERKKKKGRQDKELFYFHPEDEVLARHASAYGNYEFQKNDESVADSKRAFQEMGIAPRGLMMVVEASKFPAAVNAMNEYINTPS